MVLHLQGPLKKHTKEGLIIRILCAAFCAVTSIVIACIPDFNGYYDWLLFLPLSHGIILMLSFSTFDYISEHSIRLLIVVAYTVRNVVAPLFFALGQYEIATISATSQSAISYAVFLMIYETIIVFFALNIAARKQNRDERQRRAFFTEKKYYFNWLYFLVVSGFTVAMIGCVVLVPKIMKAYQNLWTADEDVIRTTFSEIQDYSVGSAQRLMYAFFLMFFSMMQIIWSYILIKWINRLLGDRIIAIILSFGVLAINTFFVSETSAYTVMVLAVLVVFMIRLYDRKRWFIVLCSVLGFLAVLILMIVVRMDTYLTHEGNSISKLATFLNAYFPGVLNVSVMRSVTVPSKGATLYQDLYSSIPLQSLIPARIEGETLSFYFNTAAGTTYEILPMIGQTTFYFGALGPLVQCLIVTIALRWERKAHLTDNYLLYLAYMTAAVIFGIGVVMYEMAIILSFFFKVIIPFFLVAFIGNIKMKS